MFSAIFLLFFLTRLVCLKHLQERERKLEAAMAKHVQANHALKFTVAALNERVSALGNSLKDQQMESNNALLNIQIGADQDLYREHTHDCRRIRV